MSRERKPNTVGKPEIVRLILRPVLKYCLRRSVKLQELTAIMKEELVSCAEDLVRKSGDEPNASKISIMTGVHRKDVTALLKGSAPQSQPASVISKVIGHWQIDKRFSRRGTPNTLSCTGTESEFAELIRSVNSEVNPYTVLNELCRAELVRREGDEVSLLYREYVPSKDSLKMFSSYAPDAEDLLAAVEDNALRQNDTPHLHLKTEFDNVPSSALPQIRRWFIAEGDKLHEKARKFLGQFDRDLNPKIKDEKGKHRIAIGTFSYVAPTEGNEEVSSGKSRSGTGGPSMKESEL